MQTGIFLKTKDKGRAAKLQAKRPAGAGVYADGKQGATAAERTKTTTAILAAASGSAAAASGLAAAASGLATAVIGLTTAAAAAATSGAAVTAGAGLAASIGAAGHG